MSRAAPYLAVGVACGALAVAFVGGGASHATPSADAPASDRLALFARVFETVRDAYVDEPDENKMVVGAVNGMLASLDPHSTYLDAKALGEFQNTMKGEEFGGLGLEVMQEGDLVRVVSPIDDTPAARAGLMSGDVITAIDDTPVKGLSLKEAVDRMRGPAKTSVKLTVQRDGDKSTREFTIVREIIKVLPVRARLEGGGDIGYIRITQFNQETYDGAAEGDRPLPQRSRRRTSSRATSSTCATTPAACSPNRSRSSTPSSTTARSSRPAGAALDQQQEYYARSGGDLSQRQAAGRADQRRLGLGLGDRLRRAAGPQARDADRHALVRQGLGADRAAARRRRGAEADDGALLHAVGPLDPGQGHRARHQGARSAFPTTSRARSTARARPRSPAI